MYHYRFLISLTHVLDSKKYKVEKSKNSNVTREHLCVSNLSGLFIQKAEKIYLGVKKAKQKTANNCGPLAV